MVERINGHGLGQNLRITGTSEDRPAKENQHAVEPGSLKALLFDAPSRMERTRHVDQPRAGKLPQLQLHGRSVQRLEPLVDQATGRAEPVSELRRAFDTVGPRAATGAVRLLEHNTEAWLSIWHALSSAKGPVDASYFIFQRDVFGMAFLGQLLTKARNNQKVRLMLDAAGDALGRRGFTLTFRGQDYLQELVNTNNAEVKVYHPLHKKVWTNLKSEGLPFAGLANNHDKLLRTDDFVITGGRNISKDYFTAPEDRGDVYRDTDVLIHGRDACRAFRSAFDDEWKQDMHFHVHADTNGNVIKRDMVMIGAAVMMDQWLNAKVRSPAEKARLRDDAEYRKAQAETLMNAALAKLPEHGIDRKAGFLDLLNLRRLARELTGYAELKGAARGFDPKEGLHANQEIKAIDRTSAVVKNADDLTAALGALAAGAKKRILIQNPYVVLTSKAVQALEAAGNRGVTIDLLTNSPDSSDSVLTQAFFLEDWPRILARIPNMRIFVLTGEQKLHAKVATADDVVSVVGSYNLDLLSEQVNGEVAALTWSEALAKDIRKSFENDLRNPAHRVVEYTIQRDELGRPILDDGEPIVTFGPENHMSTWSQMKYWALCFMVRQLRKLAVLRDIGGIELPATPRDDGAFERSSSDGRRIGAK